MAYLENNSTNKLLLANEQFIGTTVQIPADFVAAQVSFNVAGSSGRLEFLHSFNGVNFQTYGDIFDFEPGEHARQVSLKAQFFRVKYINGSSNQTNFNLHTRIGKGGAFDDMNVNIDYRYDSISVVAGGTGLNTRLLTIDDEITIPSLDACITGGNSVNVNITGGSLVIGSDTNIFASNGDVLTATSGGLDVHVDNFSDIPKLSSTTDSVTIPALTSVKDSVTAVISGTVPISGSVSITNQITGYATSANQTTSNNLLTDIKNKTINKTTDSINITNQNINVNPRIESSNYDLVLQGATLWADTTPVLNPFFADLFGREGWYYNNLSNIDNISNIYWYANPTSGSLQENDMTFSQLSSMYSIITCDYVDNGSLTIPTMGVYSQPTGTNDIAPGFAHSRWVYQLSSANLAKLRKGECILIYTGATRPNVFNELPAYPLVQVSVIGEAQPSEIIAYMTVNTQRTTSQIGYLLQYVGYLNSSVGYNKQYGFQNSKNRVIQNNLYNLNDLNVNVDNFPTSQTINGSVSVDNFPAGITHVFIDNFPASQTINGSVSVDNFPAGITHVFVDNFPASQTINGSVSVDNFPAGITHVFIDNFPASQTINGSVSVNNFPEGITHVFIDNFPASQTINGSVSVDNFPEGITHVFIDNFPASQTINGSISVDNFPAGITHVFIDNFPASQTINGTVTVNTISGFAVESGGNLASIKSNTDKLNSVTFTGDNLNTNISNTVTVTNGTNPLGISGSISNTGFKVLDSNGTAIGGSSTALYTTLRDTSGSAIGVSGNPLSVSLSSGSGFDGKAYLYSGNGTTPITQTTISTKSGIDSNIINSSLNTHLYSFHNSNWVEVESAANGHLLVNASMQDGDGVSLTSTLNGAKQSLDVNVSNISAIPISGTVGLSSGSVIKISDGVDTADVVSINTSMLATQEKGLATVSAVYGASFSGGTIAISQPITMTNITEAVPNGKNALDTYDFRVDSKLTTTNNTLSNINSNIGTTNNTLSTINGKLTTTTNLNGSVGLNVYNIYPKKIIYPLSGTSSAAVSSQFLGPQALAFSANSLNIGINYIRNFNIYTLSAITRNVDVEYIDINGNYVELKNITIDNNSSAVRLPNALNINRLSWSPTSGNASNNATVYARDTFLGVYRNNLSSFFSGSGIIMCPIGYVGVVHSVFYFTANGDDLIMTIKDKYNNIKRARYMPNITPINGKYFNVGDLNEPLYEGDSVFFASSLAGSGDKYIHAIVTLEAI